MKLPRPQQRTFEIAVLDAQGVIESVNAAWLRFSEANNGDPTKTGVGASYLAACDAAVGEPGAAEVATAIRSALAGDLAGAAVIEIECHSPREDRWFDVLVYARTNESGTVGGATVVLTPTAAKTHPPAASDARSVVDLRSEKTVAPLSDIPGADGAVAWAMVEASPDALVMADEHGVIELVNGQAEKLFGYDRLELLGRPVEMLLPARFAKQHTAHRTRFRVAPETRTMGTGLDLWARRADGTEVPVEVSLSPLQVHGELRVIAAVRDVSDRVAADAEARRIRSGFDSIRDGVYMFSPQTLEFNYVNQGAVDQSGYTHDELLDRMTPLHMAPEFSRPEFLALLGPLIQGDVPSIHFETITRHKSGDDFPVGVVMDCPRVADEQHQVIIAVVRDISERVAAEHDALIVQHSINSVSDAVFVCDEHTLEFVHVNQGALDLHGFSREELLSGMTPLDLAPDLPPEYLAGLLERLRNAPHESGQISAVGVSKNGDPIHVDVRINWPEPSSPTAARPVVAVVRDMTAQIEAERRQHETDAKFRTAFDDGPVPMTIIEVSPTVDRVIIEANQAMADLLGYTVDQLVGMSVAEYSHPDDLDEDDQATDNQLAGTQDTFTARKRYLRSDGQVLWVDLHVRLLSRDSDRILTVGNSLDVTAIVEAEQTKLRSDALSNSLSELRLKMLQGASRPEALELICAGVQDVLDASSVLVLTPADAGTELRIEAASGLGDEVRAGLSFHRDQGVAGVVFTTGEPQYSGLGDERIPEVNTQVVESQRIESILMAPLHGASEVFGVLLVSRKDPNNPLDDADLATIEQFALAAVAAVEVAAVRDARTQMDLLEDRERIGRDMHDKVIGRLFATGMGMQAGAAQIADPAVKERMIGAVDQIDQAIKEIRTAVFGIKSGLDWGKGNKGEILSIAADQNESLGFEPRVSFSGPIDELSAEIVEEILATMREAFTNVAKYAAATSVVVSVAVTARDVILTIEDNGIGIDSSEVGTQDLTGNGLGNMNRRAQHLGGIATVISAPGEGTTINWTVPFQ